MDFLDKVKHELKRFPQKKFVGAQFERYKQIIHELIDEHDSALRQIGLPVPTRIGNTKYTLSFRPYMKYTDSSPDVLIWIPSFEIPIHRKFCLGRKHWLVFTESLEEVQEAFEDAGLGQIASYPHVTTDCDPYKFYKECNSKKQGTYFSISGGAEWWLNRSNLNDHSYHPIPKKLSDLTVTEAAGVNFRVELFNHLTSYSHESLRLEEKRWESGGAGYYVPEEILWDTSMQLPYIDPPINETPYTNIKILPAGEIKPALMASFLSNLRSLNLPIAFELIASARSIYYQLGVPEKSVSFVKQQLSHFFPLFAALDEPAVPELPELSIVRAYQDYAFYYSLAALGSFSIDPYNQIASILEHASEQEFLCLQIILRPISDEAGAQLREAVGKNFSKQLSKKLPIWVAGISSISTKEVLAHQLMKGLAPQYNTPEQTLKLNDLVTWPNFPRNATDFLVLSTDELTSLAHFPITPLPLPSLETTSMKAQLPPEIFTTGEVPIGIAEARGKRVPVTLPNSFRDRHLYIVGKTRMGKSTLITNIALSDIERGAGVCVIDPHGDLVEDLLNSIPLRRVRDTIYFNANDKEYPIALNVLQAKNEDEVALMADNLHVTFRRLSESWGQRMDDILRATLQTLAATPGATFVDIKKLLQDPSFRGSVTANLEHPMLRDFWQLDFPAYPKDAPTPIISRVNRFLYAPHFYRMFSTTENALSISDVVESQKILLVNLASGAIGDDNASILGSLLVSQIQQAVMRRAGLPKAARTPYYLFVDEFQNFTNSAFDKILSEAGKYNLCLTLAHQFISQLPDSQRDAIFGNVGTMIMFGVGDKDATSLRNQLGNYEPADLLNMPPYQALCRPATRASDTFHFTALPPPPDGSSYAANIIESTRANHSITPDKRSAKAQETAPAEQVEIEPTPRVEVRTPPPPRIETELHAHVGSVASLKPAVALPKEFGSTAEKILYYIDLAEYLSTQQIIAFCYSH